VAARYDVERRSEEEIPMRRVWCRFPLFYLTSVLSLAGCAPDPGPEPADTRVDATSAADAGPTPTGALGDPCRCSGQMCIGDDSGCEGSLSCLGSPSVPGAQRCASTCTAPADCPSGFACTVLVIDTVSYGSWCSR
jgi:hypothetical protein